MQKLHVSDLVLSTSALAPPHERHWKTQHNKAISAYLSYRAEGDEALTPPADEAGILALVDGVAFYVGRLGQQDVTFPDGYLTQYVGAILGAIVGLLSGPVGRLDMGTVDSWARDVAARIGWDLDTEQVVWPDDDEARATVAEPEPEPEPEPDVVAVRHAATERALTAAFGPPGTVTRVEMPTDEPEPEPEPEPASPDGREPLENTDPELIQHLEGATGFQVNVWNSGGGVLVTVVDLSQDARGMGRQAWLTRDDGWLLGFYDLATDPEDEGVCVRLMIPDAFMENAGYVAAQVAAIFDRLGVRL